MAFWSNSHQLWTAVDAFLVLVCGLLSIPSMPLGLLIISSVSIAIVGFGIDLLVVQFPKPVRIVAILLPVFAIGILAMITPGEFKKAFRESRRLPYNRLVHLGLIVPMETGNRIVLETGAVAWVDYPRGEGPYPGALFFHGAHSKGSRQPAALVVRRALRDAGFVVLSVDHPGYGESPILGVKSDVNTWDPLPTDLAALRTLRNMKMVDKKRILVLGHSAGTYEVFRLLRSLPDVVGAVVFGASLNYPKERDEYWYERFHSDRRMQVRIPRGLFEQIRTRFYDNGRAVPEMDPRHAPVLFARFELEWPYLAATRAIVYKAIPGRKALWDIDSSSHYFNSFEVGNLVVGDTKMIRLLSSKLRILADHADRSAASRRQAAISG
jgi:pimeloyl-ACP methyl ester carboxylesterase